MIGIDTNVLVRYLAQDDPDQAAQATRLIEQQLSQTTQGFIGLVVLVETIWVLQRLYRASADEIHATVADLLGSPVIFLENRPAVVRALALARQSACGVVDAVIAASALGAGCDRVMTFDRRAVRAGMTLVD
jgi:predicted nucleic-acid-binding protein